jgi:phage shock protein A
MHDLFKKLNVLVKATVHDALGGRRAADSPRHRSFPAGRLGKDVDREIAALRQRVNEALEYEEELQAKVQALRQEVAHLDEEADAAVAEGRDSAARHIIEQMQRTQQRLVMAESDLREHRIVTQELMQRVNMLDATVADARRAESEAQATEGGHAAAKAEEAVGQGLSELLREVREKIAEMGDIVSTRGELATSSGQLVPDEQAIEEDLENRRRRLGRE